MGIVTKLKRFGHRLSKLFCGCVRPKINILTVKNFEDNNNSIGNVVAPNPEIGKTGNCEVLHVSPYESDSLATFSSCESTEEEELQALKEDAQSTDYTYRKEIITDRKRVKIQRTKAYSDQSHVTHVKYEHRAKHDTSPAILVDLEEENANNLHETSDEPHVSLCSINNDISTKEPKNAPKMIPVKFVIPGVIVDNSELVSTPSPKPQPSRGCESAKCKQAWMEKRTNKK